MPLIDLRNLHKHFGKLVVLDGVSIAIPEGQSIVIIGASGTGKSVLLKHVVGLLHPDTGEVWFDGKRIDTLNDQELDPIRKQLGFLFQQGALFDSLTVEDNIAFPLREHTTKSPQEISQIVDEKLAMVGLPETRTKMPAELSGGQRKRVALARAIALNPRVILYDEPTTGLDPIRSDVINELILKLQRELKVTSITVTHDMHSAFKIADRIVMLFKGKVIFDGTPQEIQKNQDERIRNFVTGRAGPEDMEGLTIGPAGGAAAMARQQTQSGRTTQSEVPVQSDVPVQSENPPGAEQETPSEPQARPGGPQHPPTQRAPRVGRRKQAG